MSHWMKCNNTFLFIQEFFFKALISLTHVTHVVYSISNIVLLYSQEYGRKYIFEYHYTK